MRKIYATASIAFLSILVACETESGIANSIADVGPDYQVSAVQLFAEYESNEAAADKKY